MRATGVIGLDLAYSQDKAVYQIFKSTGKPICEKSSHTLSTKLMFNVRDTVSGFIRETQVLEQPYLVGYDKFAEDKGELFLGTRLFSEKVIRSRVAACLLEICKKHSIEDGTVEWYLRTGVPVEYSMFVNDVVSFLKEPITTQLFNSTKSVTHRFVNIRCDEQPAYAAQALFYTHNDGVVEYKDGFNDDSKVCAVDCGSQVVNFTLFGPPAMSLKNRKSAKVGTWSLLSQGILPILCKEENIDFHDDYDVMRVLRTGKIGHTDISNETKIRIRRDVFEANFSEIESGITRLCDPRELDVLLYYGGSAHEYVNISKNVLGDGQLIVMAADNSVLVTAEGMFVVAFHHFTRALRQK